MMSETTVNVTVRKRAVVEEIEGGLFFVTDTAGVRKAATSQAAMLKLLNTALGLERKKRGPNKPKEEKSAPKEEKSAKK